MTYYGLILPAFSLAIVGLTMGFYLLTLTLLSGGESIGVLVIRLLQVPLMEASFLLIGSVFSFGIPYAVGVLAARLFSEI